MNFIMFRSVLIYYQAMVLVALQKIIRALFPKALGLVQLMVLL